MADGEQHLLSGGVTKVIRDPKVTGETIEVQWFPVRIIIILVIFIGVPGIIG